MIAGGESGKSFTYIMVLVYYSTGKLSSVQQNYNHYHIESL